MTAFLAVATTSHLARAQAWVGEKGSLDASLDYNLGTSSKVIGKDTAEFPNAGVQTHQLTIGAEYVPIPKLAIDVGVPMIFIKYTGDKTLYPHGPMAKYDDGSMHFTPTDLAARVRYAVIEDPIAIAPHIGVSIPLADYATVGNAVAGRHLKALHLGVAVGKIFAETFYAHVLYDFALTEKYDATPETKKYSQNRSDLSVTVGDALLDGKLDVNLGANYHLTHGGINFEDFGSLSMNELIYHDAILKENVFLVGAGVGYNITPKLNLAFAARLFVSGANTQNASVFGLSLGWTAL